MALLAAAFATLVAAGSPSSDDCLAFYYGIGRPRDLPAARRCLEGALRSPCGGSSPDLYRAELAVMYLDGQGGPAEPDRAWALLHGCFEDVTVQELRERFADRKATGTFDFCKEIGGTTLTINDCARLRAADADVSRDAAVARLRRLLPPELHRLLDGAEQSWSAFVSGAVAVAGDRYRGGSIVTSIELETDRRLTALRARWLDGLVDVRPADCDAAALAAEDRRLNAAYRKEADGDPQWKALLRSAQRAWIVSRDADAALSRAWKGEPYESTVRCLATRARAAAIEADLAERDGR